MIIKLYNTWRKVKDTFVKPSVKVYFGKWKNDGGFPVWRRGPVIYLCGRKHRYEKTHAVHDSVMIYTGTKESTLGGKPYTYKCYEWAPRHKLPGNLNGWDLVWNSDIRRKLRKWHLGWIPAEIKFPSWMMFHIVNWDVGWKLKWDEVRYEHPPQFSIIGFGLSLTITLHGPKCDEFAIDDHYWESILIHTHKNKSGTLKETIEHAGQWRRLSEGNEANYFAVRPGYIAPNKLEEYYAAVSDIKRKDNKIIL